MSNERLIYTAPEFGTNSHHFSLEVSGTKIGEAIIFEYLQPFHFYQLAHLFVKKGFENQGYASKIMDSIEAMLKEKNVAGVLADQIWEDSPAKGMYARRGWVPLPGPKLLQLHAYNLPEGADIPALVAKLSER